MEKLSYGGDEWRDYINDDGDVLYDDDLTTISAPHQTLNDAEVLQLEYDFVMSNLSTETVTRLTDLHTLVEDNLLKCSEFDKLGYKDKADKLRRLTRQKIISGVAIVLVGSGETGYYGTIKDALVAKYHLDKNVPISTSGSRSAKLTRPYIDGQMLAAGEKLE